MAFASAYIAPGRQPRPTLAAFLASGRRIFESPTLYRFRCPGYRAGLMGKGVERGAQATAQHVLIPRQSLLPQRDLRA